MRVRSNVAMPSREGDMPGQPPTRHRDGSMKSQVRQPKLRMSTSLSIAKVTAGHARVESTAAK